MPKKFVGTRDVSCPTCGEPAGSPCRLRSGKPLEDLHCTDRVTKAGGVEPMTPPSPAYTPGEWEPTPAARPATPSPLPPADHPDFEAAPGPAPQPVSRTDEGSSATTPRVPEPTGASPPADAPEPTYPAPEKDPPPSRRRRKAAPEADPELMPALF